MDKENKSGQMDLGRINEAIHMVCNRTLGVLDSNFLCKSLGVLNPRVPHCISDSTLMSKALEDLRQQQVGCLLVLDGDGKLAGIFSERDCLTKIVPEFQKWLDRPIRDAMTKEPVTQTLDSTIGFALTLMSEGGFRHLPIVDEQGQPTGIISVKDVMDYIVRSFINDALAFEAAEG